MRRTLTSGLLAALALAGCGGASTEEHVAQVPAHDAMSGMQHHKASHVSFVVPRNGGRSSGTIDVKVRLKNFKLDPQDVGKAPKAGFGHLHFSLDGGRYDHPRYSGANGALGKALGVAGQYSPSLTPSITYRHIPAGRHKLEVYLANNNHTSTGVEAEVRVTVR